MRATSWPPRAPRSSSWWTRWTRAPLALPSLAIGATSEVTFTIGPLAAGTHTMRIVVDPGETLDEWDETNNAAQNSTDVPVATLITAGTPVSGPFRTGQCGDSLHARGAPIRTRDASRSPSPGARGIPTCTSTTVTGRPTGTTTSASPGTRTPQSVASSTPPSRAPITS